MNDVHLVESGKYSKEDLTPQQLDILNGMEYVTDKLLPEAMDACFDNYMVDGMHTTNQMLDDFKNSILENLKDYLYACECQTLVEFADENAN